MLNVAVIGAGVMGANHVRVLNSLPMANVLAVVDSDPDRARAAAGAVEAATYATLDDLFANLTDEVGLDAAVVATPTAYHFEIAAALIAHGVHVLVEKPIAGTAEDGEKLIELAEAAGVVLTVGHIERYNSVVQELQRTAERPIHIEARRIGPFASRIPDSVVGDLMIHDLDIVRTLARGELSEVTAIAQSQRTDSEDMATALLTFDNGVTATVTASRLGQQKVRQVHLTMPDSYILGDLLLQDVTVTRVEHTEYVSDDGSRYRQTAAVEIPFLENRGEPLTKELAAFLRAVETGDAPLVSAQDGVEAVRMVDRVLAAIRG